PRSFERAALRWLGRYVIKGKAVSLRKAHRLVDRGEDLPLPRPQFQAEQLRIVARGEQPDRCRPRHHASDPIRSQPWAWSSCESTRLSSASTPPTPSGWPKNSKEP